MLGVVDRQYWKGSYVTPERSEVYPVRREISAKSEFLMDRFPPIKKRVSVLKTFQSCVRIVSTIVVYDSVL